ncbi:MAG TPA: hypothetical protein VF469_08065 [Kofleriaceae bacterium]
MVRRSAVALLAALGGCTLITDSFLTNDFSGDPFPIGVDRTSGAVLVGARPSGDTQDRRAVLDLLSPFTLVDPGTNTEPSLGYADLTLLGKRPDGTLTLPRARFPQAQLISLHPCPDVPDPQNPPALEACQVGTVGNEASFDAVIGADALAGDAVRLRLAQDQIFVLADIGGSDRGRTLDCDAVFDSPYRGGGTLLLAGTELSFGNRRITLQACLGPDPDPDTSQPFDPATFRQHGADALFVVSTGLGISILGRAAYDRYLMAVASDRLMPPPVPFDQLAPGSVFLPSGLVTGRLATVDRLALVAASTGNALSPCRQLYAHRLLTTYTLTRTMDTCQMDSNGNSARDCPCKTSGDLFCSVPAILELTPPAGIDVLVVDDTDPTLQALRTELRPDQPEVDGILGTDVLRGAEIDVDYPHDRLLARCPGDHCSARPALAQQQDICQINRCITGVFDASGCTDRLPDIPPLKMP